MAIFNVTITSMHYFEIEVEAVDADHATRVASAMFDDGEGLSLFRESENVDYDGGPVTNDEGDMWFGEEGEKWYL